MTVVAGPPVDSQVKTPEMLSYFRENILGEPVNEKLIQVHVLNLNYVGSLFRKTNILVKS